MGDFAGFRCYPPGSWPSAMAAMTPKTMGIMTLALVTAGIQTSLEPPLWVILTAASAISLGTAAGGWRIIKTMGNKVVRLDPVHGFAAETSAASVILGASYIGVPVSTTQVITSAIIGVGSSNRLKQVRWSVCPLDRDRVVPERFRPQAQPPRSPI